MDAKLFRTLSTWAAALFVSSMFVSAATSIAAIPAFVA